MRCPRCNGRSTTRRVPDELRHLTSVDALCKLCIRRLADWQAERAEKGA